MRGRRIAFASFVLLSLAVGCNEPAITSQPHGADEYASRYGGQAAEYRAILEETSCRALQDRLYVATDNGAYGYQTAIMDRGRTLGCPDFQLSDPLGSP